MTYLVRWLSFGLLALVTFWLESYAVLWHRLDSAYGAVSS